MKAKQKRLLNDKELKGVLHDFKNHMDTVIDGLILDKTKELFTEIRDEAILALKKFDQLDDEQMAILRKNMTDSIRKLSTYGVFRAVTNGKYNDIATRLLK